MHLPGLDHAGLFDASPNPYLVLNRGLHIVGANRAYLASVKRELADLTGRWAWEAFPTDPETERQAIASFERVIATREPDTMALLRFDVPRPDVEGGGFEERWWSITHAPVLDAQGEVALVLQHPIDVTELQKLRQLVPAEEAERLQAGHTGIFERAARVSEQNLRLKAESEELRGLFEKAPGFMCILSGPEHVFEFANEAYYRVVDRADLIGRPIRKALADLEGQGIFDLLDQVFSTGQRHVARSLPVRLQPRPDAPTEVRFVDFIYEPVREADGQVSGIFVQGHDVTEMHRAQEALRVSEER